DLSLFWLHVASLVLPFVFGFIYRQTTTEYLSSDLISGGVLAAAALLAMSSVVAGIDKVPVLPTDWHGGSNTSNTAPALHWHFRRGGVPADGDCYEHAGSKDEPVRLLCREICNSEVERRRSSRSARSAHGQISQAR